MTPPSRRHPRGFAMVLAMLALMLTLLLEALDQTIVGTAMPRVIGQLHGLDRYTWAISTYLLASTTAIPIAGGLSDQFGRKRFLLGGTAVFLLGSMLCAAAQSIDQLIAFRAVQGAGAGTGIVLVFAAVGDLAPPRKRGAWFGMVNGVYVVSSVTGPALGGWLADHGPTLGTLVSEASRWRWVFCINLPLGLLALLGLAVCLPDDAPHAADDRGRPAARDIDMLGAALCALATLSLLFGLTWGVDSLDAPRVVAALTAASLLFVAFVVVERRAPAPILPPRLFRHRVFAANAVLSLLLSMALFGMAMYVPLFVQGVLGATATQSGVVMTPFSVAIAVASMLGGFAIAACKRYQFLAVGGALLMAAGVFLLTRMTPTTGLSQASLFVAVAGAGIGVLFAAVGVVALNTVPPADMGAGAGATRYLGQIGGSVGVAVVANVVNHSLSGELARRIPITLVRRLAADGLTVATNPQVLVDRSYRPDLTRRAIDLATARVPMGQVRGRLMAARQVSRLLDQLFDILRASLGSAIQHGLVAVLVFCAAAVVAASMVTDARLER
jgi:MFS family permease